MIARYVSLAILVFLTIVLGFTFFQVIVPFLLPLFLASVVALMGQPVYRYFLKRTKNRTALAAGLATSSLMAAVILPVFVGVTLGALQLYEFVTDERGVDIQNVISNVRQGEVFENLSNRIERFFPVADQQEEGDQVLTDEQKIDFREKLIHDRAEQLRVSFQKVAKDLAISTLSPGTAMTTVDIASKLGWMSMGLFTFVIALYYFFAEGPKLLDYAIELIPVNVEHQRLLFDEFGKAIRAVVSATFLAAIAQGLATSVALWFLGFDHFFLLTIVATFSALIPLAGTWLVWMPCAVNLIYTGSWGWALALAIYGFGFIGMLDNIIRAYVLNTDAKLHPLLAFVSVMGGLQVMGLWGVFIAPVVASCLYALIRIFNEELIDIAKFQKETSPGKQEEKKQPELIKEKLQPDAEKGVGKPSQ